MPRIQIDQVLRQRLGGMTEPLELCDASGQVVGHFLPEASYKKMLYGTLKVPLSDEEVGRRRQETGGRSLGAIWQRLRHS